MSFRCVPSLADYRDAKQLMAIREFMIERGLVMSADGEALLRELVDACRFPGDGTGYEEMRNGTDSER